LEKLFSIILLIISGFLIGCQTSTQHLLPLLGAGFRFSTYGPANNPGPEYWATVGDQMAAKVPDATPQTIWIVGNIYGEGTYLNFPCTTSEPYIHCGFIDMNDVYLSLFDERGVDVWLQVEPGNANVEELIRITLDQYSHHPCVIGFGLDVEWYKSPEGPIGVPITNNEANLWVEAVRDYKNGYYLFLKHWDINWMPLNARDGIVFINDRQDFSSLENMLEDFSDWGNHFDPSPVGFQFGYLSDRKWWGEYPDPAGLISNSILDEIPNTRALFWVDFTVLQVFPPE
jgi:hypothetical protein